MGPVKNSWEGPGVIGGASSGAPIACFIGGSGRGRRPEIDHSRQLAGAKFYSNSVHKWPDFGRMRRSGIPGDVSSENWKVPVEGSWGV